MVVPLMPAVAVEEVHERAGEQQEIWRETEGMCPVFAKDEEDDDDGERGCHEEPCAGRGHRLMLLSLRELPMTLTEESAIAAAAMMGDSRTPKAG